jgi:thiamine-monophosphate kinase
VQDLGHICEASGVGAVLRSESIPLGADLRASTGEEALALALNGGEDYQLLLCGQRTAIDGLIADGIDLTVIGEMEAGEPSVRVVDAGGRQMTAPAGRAGWDHFGRGQA